MNCLLGVYIWGMLVVTSVKEVVVIGLDGAGKGEGRGYPGTPLKIALESSLGLLHIGLLFILPSIEPGKTILRSKG